MAENQAQSTRKWLATAKTVRHAVTTVAATAKPLPALPHLGPVFPILRPVLMPSCACPVKGPRVPVPPRSVPALVGGAGPIPPLFMIASPQIRSHPLVVPRSLRSGRVQTSSPQPESFQARCQPLAVGSVALVEFGQEMVPDRLRP